MAKSISKLSLSLLLISQQASGESNIFDDLKGTINSIFTESPTMVSAELTSGRPALHSEPLDRKFNLYRNWSDN